MTVFSRPKGLPTAIAQSPTLIFVESPKVAFGQGPFPSSLRTAKSVKKSWPTSFAFNFFRWIDQLSIFLSHLQHVH